MLIFDYEYFCCIRKIDVAPIDVKWNEKGTKVALICQENTFILTINQEAIDKYIEKFSEKGESSEDSCVEGFSIESQINEQISSATWVEDVFVFLDSRNKLQYCLSSKIFPISTLSGK